MKRTVDIVLLYEKAHRELDVACAMKVMAERRGLSFEIIHQDRDYGIALRDLDPRIVLLPFCYQNRSNNIYLMRWRNSVFINLTWEQFFYPGNQRAKTPRGDFPLDHVIHCSWSRAYSELLSSINIPNERIFQCGNPALALYRERYRTYFKDRLSIAREYGLDPERKWVFFPENFNWAFYEESMLSQMVADGQPREQVEAMREFSTRSFEVAVRWCARLVKDAGVELILRPRPATIPERMGARVRELLGEVPSRLHVLQTETVREWILSADIVISTASTSLIEAAVAQKDLLMIEPEPVPDSLIQAWNHLAPKVTSYEALLSAVRNPMISGARARGLTDWAHKTLLGSGDPLSAIVNYLAEVRRGLVPVPPPATRASVTYGGASWVPSPVWWAWKYLLSFVFEYKARAGLQSAPSADIIADIAQGKTIASRCGRWANLLPD